MSNVERLQAARELIETRQYDAARALLQTINDPKAKQWLAKLDSRGLPTGVTAQDRANARMKSYTAHVVVVLVLYLFLFIPGLIANVIFHNEGKRMEAIAGQSLPGVDALGFMRRWLFILMIVILVVLVVFLLIPLLPRG
jgi:hypothetical protein